MDKGCFLSKSVSPDHYAYSCVKRESDYKPGGRQVYATQCMDFVC